MSFIDNIKNSFNILVLNQKALLKVANERNATLYGFLTLALAGFIAALPKLDITYMLLNAAAMVIVVPILYSIYHFTAKFIFGGKATAAQYFRSLSNSFVLYWVTFWLVLIPVVGSSLQTLVGLWMIVVNMFILNKVHKLSVIKSIIVGLIPIILLAILAVILFGAFLGTILMSSQIGA